MDDDTQELFDYVQQILEDYKSAAREGVSLSGYAPVNIYALERLYKIAKGNDNG